MSNAETDNKSLWRQPLLHFLLAGAAIFALNAIRGSSDTAGVDRVVVTTANVERLAQQWELTWGRPPGETELQTMVRNYIKEEIYYREALKLGLDVNDPVIRQRLGRKMEYLMAGELTPDSVNDEALKAYYDRNSERYLKSPVFDFHQIYFAHRNDDGVESDNADSSATQPVSRISKALERLRSGAATDVSGDPIGLPGTLNTADEATITRTFGSDFYAALNTLDIGVWSNPVKSGYGYHLVKIDKKLPARVPALAEVRGAVMNDWLAEQNTLQQNKAYEELRAGYEVKIEVDDK